MDEERMRELSLPLNIKPFRVRTQEAWAAFLAGEGELRALMDQKDRGAVSGRLVERCGELLTPAFASPSFELGYNGEKYALILSPEGDRARLFQLAYFQQRVPRELLKNWNILVGRTRSKSYILQMFGLDIALEDVRVWVEKTQDNGVGLRLCCEKLAPLMKEDRNQVYQLMCILLDQALGELAAMRYVDYLDILEVPEGGESIPLSELAGFVASEVDPEGWLQAGDPGLACQRYTAYEGKPSEEENWALRQDIYVGVTCCIPIISAYFQGEDYYMDRLYQDGAVPGFFYYPLDKVGRKEILDLRDQLEEAILGRTGEGVVTFTGGATGTAFGYLDFIAWDLKAVLDAAVSVFGESGIDWAMFHSFRQDADGITLFEKK